MINKDKSIELIQGLFSSSLTQEQKEELQRLLNEPTSSSELDAIMDSQWEECGEMIDIESYERIKGALLKQIQPARRLHTTWRRYGQTLLQYAALIAVVAGATIAIMQFTEESSKSFKVITDRGQQSKVELPDGTLIWLNADSQLSYNEDYNSENRNIKLSGEAYFEVAKNRDLPFTVSVGDLSVKALGTRFNVNGYSNDDFVRVSLFDGAVEASHQDQQVLLAPHEEVLFSTNENRFEDKRQMRDNIALWRTNRLKFKNSTFYDIAKQIKRIYNIECLFDDPALANLSYTGVVNNASIGSIISLIESTSPVKCEVINGILVIKHN